MGNINFKIYFDKLSLLTLMTLIVMYSCENKESSKKYTIGFSQCCDDPWRTAMNLEMRRELAFHSELNLQIRVANNDNVKQEEDIKNLVKSGIDLLIVSPNESKAFTRLLDSIFKTGLPIILVDRRTESNAFSAFVGGNNVEIGRMAASYLKTLHPYGVNALEFQLSHSITPAIERSQGFTAEFVNNPKHRIIRSLELDREIDSLKQEFQNILNTQPEINSIFAHSDFLAHQASSWLKGMAWSRSITIVGVDGLPGEGNGIDLVENDDINASLLYPTGGSESIMLALSILNNLPYEKINKLNTIVINKSNARTVHLQFKKIENLQETIDKQIGLISSLQMIFRTQRNYIVLLLTSLLVSMILGWFLWQSLRKKQKANQELVEKNNEIMEKQLQILEMSDELKVATNAKVNFFTNISHELRTPLTLIMGVSDELLTGKGNEKQKNSLVRQIQQNSIRLLRLINQLMDFRKVEFNKMNMSVSEYNIIDFIKIICDSYSSIAAQRNISFKFLTKTEEIKLWFDPDKMDKVIFNLLSNAFKFTPDHGKLTVSIITDSYEKTVKINVEDSGDGIDLDEFEKIFEPFYQIKSVHSAGTGLGLSLSKSLVELHKGSITVQSIKGHGARFTVTLPIGKDHFSADQIIKNEDYVISTDSIYDESLNYQLGQVNDREIKHIDSFHIHIIEDNAEIQHFLLRNLESKYQITQSITGNDGFAQATNLVPDLLICDLSLPGMDGIDIVKALKNDLRTSHIPIIILTSKATVTQQIAAMQAGAESFITKPFNIHVLEATIQNLIHNRQILKESMHSDVIDLRENTSLKNIDQDFISRLSVYIQNHFTDPQFQINDLCEEMQLSRSQLYRKAKSLLGENISDFIQNKRLSHAEKLLLATDTPIADIAYSSGFSSPDYFSTVFKQKYNVTPSQFRRNPLDDKNII